MPTRFSLSQGFVLRFFAAAAVLSAALSPIVSSGCSGKVVCIQKSFSITECPNRQDALSFFQQGCAPIVSVDSDPVEEGGDCCYEVTEFSGDFPPCANTVGTGPVGSGTTGSGIGSPCQGAIGGSCGECAATQCCTEISTCLAVPGCATCLNDETQCANTDFTAQSSADGLDACLRKGCALECFGAESKKPDCGAPYPGVPSAGSCVGVDEITFFCNPVSNDKCDPSSVCSFDGAAFNCVFQPQTHFLCEACGATNWCGIGLGCVDGSCTPYCCDNNDCGPNAHCDFEALSVSGLPVGVCLEGMGGGTGGAGGGGGAGGAGGN